MFKTKKEQSVTTGSPAPGGVSGASQADALHYTSGDVSRIAGVSLRQLQWWDERNVVSPLQEGHRRVYRQQEVIEVSVIAELRRKGVVTLHEPTEGGFVHGIRVACLTNLRQLLRITQQ